MQDYGRLYGFVSTTEEPSECAEGFWDSVDSFLARHPKIEPIFLARWPRHLSLNNNFEVSHRSVWESKTYRAFFDWVDKAGGIYMKRWGDALVKTAGVAMVVSDSQVHEFTDIGYEHAPLTSQAPGPLPLPSDNPLERYMMHQTLDLMQTFNLLKEKGMLPIDSKNIAKVTSDIHKQRKSLSHCLPHLSSVLTQRK